MIECKCGCGKTLNEYDNWGRKHYYIQGHNKGMLGKEQKKGSYKGNINWAGYKLTKIDGKYKREHRIIYEQYHKCSLLRWSDVHHINGDRLDNRIDNLQAMTHGQHSRLTNNHDCSDM